MQRAVALRLGRVVMGHPFTCVSGDTTLLTAARAEGLITVSDNKDPSERTVTDNERTVSDNSAITSWWTPRDR